MDSAAVITQVRALVRKNALEEAAEVRDLVAAAESGDSSAMFSVACAMELGNGIAKDIHGASIWLAKAAARSNVRAMNNLGVYYAEQGNEAEAMRWYSESARLGDSLAMKNLGWQLMEGRGAPKSTRDARTWLERAADQGCLSANVPLAALLREEAPKVNAFHCAQLLSDAAEDGLTDAAYEWAQCLRQGYGVAPDRAAAERWTCTAASQGHGAAQKWLKENGQSWIAEWPWMPHVSVGPLRFGEAPRRLGGALSLELDLPAVDLPPELLEEDPGSQSLRSAPYSLSIELEKGLLSAVGTVRGTDIIICHKGLSLLGASLGDALSLLDVSDWTVDELAVGDAEVTSDSLGLQLDVAGQRVRYLRMESS